MFITIDRDFSKSLEKQVTYIEKISSLLFVRAFDNYLLFSF